MFSPEDKIGDWLESYVELMEVLYWGSSVATNAMYSREKDEWTVEVERGRKALTLRPKHVVLATAVVPRRQPAPVAALLALPRPPAQGLLRGGPDPRSACRGYTTSGD